MSFNSNYLKLREQRQGNTTNNAGGSTPPASSENNAGSSNGNSYNSNYLALREKRNSMSISEKVEKRVQALQQKPLSASPADILKNSIRNGGRPTTSGGYYSRPSLGTQSEKLYSNVAALEPTLTEKRSALNAAQTSLKQAESDLQTVQSYLDQAKAAYDADPTEANASSYNQIVGAYNLQCQAYTSAFDAYSAAYNDYKPYEDQMVEALTAYRLYANQQQSAFDSWKGTIRDMATIQQDIAAIDTKIAELEEAEKAAAEMARQEKQAQYEAQQDAKPWYEKLLGYLGGVQDTSLPMAGVTPGTVDEALSQTQQSVSKETQALLDAKELLQEEYDWSQYYYYADMADASNFTEMSQYVPQERTERSALDIMLGNYSDDASGWEDPLYEYINGNEEAGAYISNAGANYYGSDNALGAIFGRATESKTESQQMTEQEVATFNYLYATQGKAAAHAYYEYLLSDLNYRQRKADEEYWAQYAAKDPVGSSVFSVAMSPMKGLSYVGQLGDWLPDRELEPNAAYNKFSYIPSAIRGQVVRQIESSGKWGKVGSFAYQTGISMADFLLASAISGNNQVITLTVMGSGAAADATISAKDRGLSDNQAFELGTAAGILEGLIESFNMDTVFKPDALKDGVIRYILKNATAEGAEEVATDIGNLVFDVWIAADQNVLQTSIDNYMQQGLTEGEAVARTFTDQALQMASNFAGGFMSGGILSGSNAGIHVNFTNQVAGELGALDLDEEDIQAFIEAGLESDPETASYKLAVEMQAKIEAGEALSNYDLSRLYQANMQVQPDMAWDHTAEDLPDDTVMNDGQTDAVAGDVTDPGGLSLPSVENDTWAPGFVTQNAQNGTQAQVNDTALPAGVPLSIADQLRQEQAKNGGVQYENTYERAAGPAVAQPAGELYVPGGTGLSDGSAERNAGAGTAEQAGVLASSPEQRRVAYADRSRATIARQNYARSLRLEKVSSLDLGLQNGTEARNIQVMPQEHWDAEMSQLADRIYNETNKSVTYVMGRIQIRGSDGTVGYARGVFTGDRIIVQADHLRIPMEQIADHEAYHAKADWARESGANLNAEIRRHIIETFSEEQFRRVLDKYIVGLRGVIDVNEAHTGEEFETAVRQIEEEIFADAYAGINAFGANADQFTGAVNERMDQLYMGKIRNQDNGTEEPTGPPDGDRYSIETLPDGKKYVRADRQVIFGNDPDSWSEQVEDYINGRIRRGQDVTLIAEDGDVLTITSTTAGKLADNHTSRGTTMSDEDFYLKANAAVHIDELAKASSAVSGVTRQDVGGRHGEFASGGWTYRTAFFMDFDGKYYRLRISAAKNPDGTIVYNIGDVKERSFPTVDGSSAKGGALGGKTSFEKSVPQTDRTVKQRFSYAGENANNADLDALARAKEMQAAGVADETIRQQTGWHTGMDGKWRWEIDDSRMEYTSRGDLGLRERRPEYARYRELLDKSNQYVLELSDEALTPEETAELQKLKGIWGGTFRTAGRITEDALPTELLSDYVKHDDLFEAYPQLRKTRLRFAKLPGGTRGQYDPEQDVITLSESLRGKPQDTLIHEIQHAIQKAEGFSGGASVEYWAAKLAADRQREVELADKKYREIFDSMPEELKAKVRAYNRADLDYDYDEAIAIENELLESEYGELFSAWLDADFERRNLRERYEAADLTEDARSNYWNTAGEIEARDAASRRRLTAEQRRSQEPERRDSYTVFAEDFDDAAFAELDAEYGPQMKSYFDPDISTEEINGNIRQVAQMDPVAQITGEEFAKGEKDLITQVEEFYAQLGNSAYNEQLGDVILDRRGVKSDIAHGIGRKKAAAFAAVPDVIEQGLVVDYQQNWKDRGYDTAVVAAPVRIGGQEHIAGVIVVRSRQTNRFYLHEVLTTENGALPFKTGALKQGDSGGDAPSVLTILDRIRAVKSGNENSERFSVDDTQTYAEIQERQQELRQRELDLRERKRVATNNPELLQAMDEYSNLFTEMRGLLPKRRNGTATQAELDRIEEIKTLRDGYMQRITDLQESLGLAAISQEETEIREEKEALRVASDAAWAREGAERENLAIEKAGVSPSEYFRRKAIKAFKTTTNFNEAGYLLPDGKLLNFSGGERNHRYRDHREIGEIYEATNGVAALNRFLADGNIRIMAESPGADLPAGVEPTREQYAALRKFINSNGVQDGRFYVDFSNADGSRAGNYAYEGRIYADRVLNDIKHYYATGETVQRMDLNQFRYSVDDEGSQQTQEQQPAAPKKKIRPVAESRPLIAKKDLRSTVLNLFSIPNGQRAEVGAMIDSYADRLIKNGTLTEDDRKALFDRMYDAGVMVMPAEEYSAFARSHIVDGRIYVSDSVKSDFGDDWADIRRRAFAAGVYLVNDRSASGIDQWNATLSAEDMLPGLFDSEETDERTILERILQVAEEGKDEHLSLAEYTRRLSQQEGISEDEFLDNMERQLDWALRTFAEKARLEVHLRDRTGRKIAQEREKGTERMTRQQAKEAQRRADERQARKDSARRAKERRELRELQQRTLKQLQWLSRNRNRAPEELQATWDEVLGDIDLYAISAADEMRWSDKHNATWKDLAQMYKDAMKNDPNFLPSKELERIVTRLDATKIADMDLGALQDLYKAAIGLRTEFYNRNNVINDEMQRLFAEVYTDAKREIESAPGGFTGGVADKFLNLDQLTPMNVLQRMAGWDPDGAFYSMAKQLERGERDMRAYSVKAQKMLQDFLTEHEDWVKKADGQGKDAIWYEVEVPQLLELGMGDKPIFGPTVKVYMTPAQKVHMYLESKNLDNLRHMTGGRTFVNKDLYSQGKRQEALSQGRTIKLAPETVRKLVSDLTPEEMEMAQLLDRYYNTFATQEINKVSNILYGYDKAMGKNYAPIYTNRNYTKTEFGVFDTTAEGVGNLKGRQYAVNPSYNISAFDAFERHVDQTARFVGMAIPARNWTTLMNWREKNNSTGDVITHKWGEESKRYITDLITTLQAGDDAKSDTISSGLSKLQSNYITAIFGANPSIVLKQLGSIPLAGAYLDARNMPTPAQISKIDRSLISKYTQELEWRTMGYATPETKQLKDNPNWTQTNKVFKFVFGGGAITAMDGWAASTLWPWAENKVRREHPELAVGTKAQIDAGESAFYKKVAEEFEIAVSRSQSVSDEIHQGTLRKSKNPITKAFTMFRSDSAQTYNALRQKIGEARYYMRTGAKEKVVQTAKKAAGTAFVAMLLNAAWSEAISFLMALWKNKGKYYRDDEDELTLQSVAGEMVSNMLGSYAGVVTGGEELFELIGNIITGDTWYGIETPGMEQLNDLLDTLIESGSGMRDLVAGGWDVVKNGGNLGDYFSKHSGEMLGGIKDLAKAAAMYLFGMPASNLEAYLTGAMKWISPELGAAYDDLFAETGKSDLAGMEGDALEGRVGRILSDRNVSESDDTAAALAALYEAGYKTAIPSDTPTSVSIDGEKHSLGEYQQQAYDTIWGGIVADALDDLVSSENFTSADPEAQAKMLSNLYTYAAERAKAELFDEYELDSGAEKNAAIVAAGATVAECITWNTITSEMKSGEKSAELASWDIPESAKREIFLNKISDSREDSITAFLDAGLSFDQFLQAYSKYGEINNMDLKAGMKAVEFSHWVNDQGYSAEQAAIVKDELTYFNMTPASSSRYDELVGSGMDPDDAYDLTGALNELQPEDGEDEVSDLQKWRASVDFSDDVDDQLAALSAVMTDAQFQKVEIANDFGVSPDAYVTLQEIKPQYDTDGNGSYKNAEIQAAIDALPGYYTAEQKAVLWQLATGSTSAKNNPYSRQVGQQVLDARAAAKEAAAQEQAKTPTDSTDDDSFSQELLNQLLGRE